MGSLMAGWGSSQLDPKSATLKRNKSLTKDEIDAYWKSKKKTEQEHLRAISDVSEIIDQASASNKEPEKKLEKSHTMPVAHLNMEVDNSLQQLIKENGWWTKSSWAFLNEPPVNEAASNKYTPQFHVANMQT